MSLIFFDGFDFYANNNVFGPGGRKWDIFSSAQVQPGRFSGESIILQGNVAGQGLYKTLPASYPSLIVGFAMLVNNYGAPSQPLLVFFDGTTAQCSVWLDPSLLTLKIRTGYGTGISDFDLLTTNYSPPLTLWFYLEVSVTIGNTGTGAVEVRVDGTSLGAVTHVQTQQSGNASCNRLGFGTFSGNNTFVSGFWNMDDMYVVNPSDSTGSVTYLGEVRVQTQYPDAEGYQDDFQPSTGTVNANNVNGSVTNYNDNGKYNYSGTVGAIDLYSVGNFTVSGTIFGVQENIAVRKDDVGNRTVAPILRTASVNYTGADVLCYSSFTWGGKLWEYNPNTNAPWDLTSLNLTEFGITITT